jgi:16S rRNA (cytosine967-C5)-methyltransferase
MRTAKPREIAARVLQRYAPGRRFLETILAAELDPANLSPADRRLAEELCFGVVRWQATLDWLIAQRTGSRRQKAPLQTLLALGLYQIFWLDRIPDHAAVHETVELAKRTGLAARAGFLNAVLRRCLRERDSIQQQLAELQQRRPALGYSHPDWLCERWRQRWGEQNLRALLEWNNTPPVNYARVNTLRADAAKLAALWEQEGVRAKARQFDWAPEGLVFELQSHPPLATLPSFQQGCFYVQDPSTLLAVIQLAPQPDETVLDLCAAPGGKTTMMAARMQNRGRIIAHDIRPERLKLLRENCARLGVNCVELADSSLVTPHSSLQCHRVLVDAPCSNTGVLRRRVDLRWRLRAQEIERLRGVQLDLLRQAAAQLKPGGTLVYSTCSLEPEENGEVVQQFLSGHTDLRLEHERLLTPFAHRVDGAYVARMVRAQ